MDAVIRFCFNKDPEDLLKVKTLNDCYATGVFVKEDVVDRYVKLYSQAKYILDYQNLMLTQNATKL